MPVRPLSAHARPVSRAATGKPAASTRGPQAGRLPGTRRQALAADRGEQPAGGDPADLLKTRVNAGQRRQRAHGHGQPVVEADEGDVVGDAPPDGAQRVRDAAGDLVAAAEDRVGPVGEQQPGRLPSPVLAPLAEPDLSARAAAASASAAVNPRARSRAARKRSGPAMCAIRRRPIASRWAAAARPPPSSSGSTAAAPRRRRAGSSRTRPGYRAASAPAAAARSGGRSRSARRPGAPRASPRSAARVPGRHACRT